MALEDGQPRYSHSPEGLRSPGARPVDLGDRRDGEAHRCAGTRADSASDTHREVHGAALAAHRKEEPRAVRDPDAYAPARHRRPDSADGRRADEPRSCRRRRHRTPGEGLGPNHNGIIAPKLVITRVFTPDDENLP